MGIDENQMEKKSMAVGSTEHCAPQKADTDTSLLGDEGGFSNVCKIVWKDVPSSTAHQLIHPSHSPTNFAHCLLLLPPRVFQSAMAAAAFRHNKEK
jgi:hypothetical protein